MARDEVLPYRAFTLFRIQIQLQSDKQTSVKPHYTALCSTALAVSAPVGIPPWSNVRESVWDLRCDSSPNINVYKGGCVVNRAIPTFKLNPNSTVVGRTANHVQKALTTPQLTDPVLPGKQQPNSIPGGEASNKPLHRIVSKTKIDANRDRAIATCLAIRAYAKPESCDEYPMASTREGANYDQVHFSVEILPLDDNCKAGNMLGWFYQRNRIVPDHTTDLGLAVSGSPFWVGVGTGGSLPSTPTTPSSAGA
ncbi:hypothetical protein Aple_101150 [Acrocarpospora pleiomorpha]|uniref:Deoxyribonuclease NucA/NucB domain-containing protein n=1 Tax=Acrocarpospora pleiomorpha TaxID=90975 RepID=A0A5M3Y1L0_9ACTN|nr:NucA/NucB deoxyribonuclease domain-containing protein [Acrocarpospora pleiomorpha]GES27215.1 hypothetical protein Aple_101150 [Acrocarpospora pleiomorpha]